MSKIDSWYGQVPVIMTEHLRLRPMEERDLADIQEIYGDRNLYRYLGRTMNLIERNPSYLFDHKKYDAKRMRTLRWGIAAKEEDKIIGELILYDLRDDKKCRIGCRINAKEQKRGYATEANRGILSYFAEQGVFPIVEADVLRGNGVSDHALKKIGFQYQGTIGFGRYLVYYFNYDTLK